MADSIGLQPDGAGKRVDARQIAKGDSGDPTVYRQTVDLAGPGYDAIFETLERMRMELTKIRILAENDQGFEVADTDAE
jgi:hypothetical protein